MKFNKNGNHPVGVKKLQVAAPKKATPKKVALSKRDNSTTEGLVKTLIRSRKANHPGMQH